MLVFKLTCLKTKPNTDGIKVIAVKFTCLHTGPKTHCIKVMVFKLTCLQTALKTHLLVAQEEVSSRDTRRTSSCATRRSHFLCHKKNSFGTSLKPCKLNHYHVYTMCFGTNLKTCKLTNYHIYTLSLGPVSRHVNLNTTAFIQCVLGHPYLISLPRWGCEVLWGALQT